MAQQQSLAHFETFARLHRASGNDLPNLLRFSERLPAAAQMGQAWWSEMLHEENTYVLVATECQLIVGVAVMQHTPSAADARLAFLCVLPDARGRGIGQLLLSTIIGRARSEGAAIINALEHIEDATTGRALLRAGFSQRGGGLWSFGLWNGHHASSYGDLSIPEHEPVADAQAAAQSLLMAMGTLDKTMLLTRRALQVVEHELVQRDGQQSDSMDMALAAARRRFFVRLESQTASRLHRQCTPDIAERISGESERLTPERILGCLSRGQLCLLRLKLVRLSGPKQQWYLINGFDGYLFRLHDVTRVTDAEEPMVVTAAELRIALGGLAADDYLVIGKIL